MIKSNTGVVVIDDVFDEAKPLLRTLNKNGIGLTYYSGTDMDEFPDKPLDGVRFLFLDFVLGTDGQPDKTKISTLMGVVKRVISEDNGPYIIFAWTKHDVPQDDLMDLFKQTIMNDSEFPKPVVIIDLEKRDCLSSFKKINSRLKKRFNGQNILEILMHWENHGRNALCDVIRMLSGISKPSSAEGQSFDDYSAAWNSELERHLCRISVAALGIKNVKADKNLLVAAQTSLTRPFQDYIENRIKENTESQRSLATRILSHRGDAATARDRAAMNSSFMLVTNNLDPEIQPGNIYRYADVFAQIKCEKRQCYYTKSKLTPQRIADEFFGGQINTFGRRRELIRGVIPIIAEITPACDYSQAKWKTARMILGVLWPENFERSLSAHSTGHKPDYVYKPLPVLYKDNIYYLTFNSHHIFNINFQVFKAVKPILKARKELLVEMQHWYSMHTSRPGKNEF